MSGWRAPSYSIEGLRQTIRDLRRDVDDLQRRGGGSAGGELGGSEAAPSGGPYVLVAASNAHAWSKAAADYVCDGTADNVQIQAALDVVSQAWNGGLVLLSEGLFNLAAPVEINVGATTLRGAGNGTTWLEGDSAVSECIAGWSQNCSVESLRVQGSDVGISAYAGLNLRIVDVRFGLTGVGGVGLDLVDGDNTFVKSCHFSNSGLRVDNRRALIAGNYFDSTPIEFTINAEDAMFDGNYVANGAFNVTDSSSSTQYGTNFSGSGAW